MNISNLPERISPEDLDRLRALGSEVADVIGSAGLPVVFQSDPFARYDAVAGASIYIDATIADSVHLYWLCAEPLRSRALTAASGGRYDTQDVRLSAEASFAMAEALARILAKAGYRTGMGVDMAEDHVWVRRP